MNIDPINIAKNKTITQRIEKAAGVAASTSAVAGAAATVVGGITSANSAIDAANKQLQNLERLNKLKDLPIQPDPELLKQEGLALAQTLRADAETMLQQRKDEEINKLKDRAEALIPPAAIKAAGLLLVLPIIDPKYLAWLAYQKAKSELKKIKQKASKVNIKRSKEAFTFPMKPPKKLELGQIPNLQIPKIPEIPRIDIPKNPLG